MFSGRKAGDKDSGTSALIAEREHFGPSAASRRTGQAVAVEEKRSGPDSASADVFALAAGDHLHLDEFFENPLPPGSPDWLPIVKDLAQLLADHGGYWVVTLPLGGCHRLPDGDVGVKEAIALAHQKDLFEPPAAYRISDPRAPNTWRGEKKSWRRQIGQGITEVVTISLAERERAAGEDWRVVVAYQVGYSEGE